MAAERSRRSNAGAMMSGLIKDFHEEETFKTLYGGFGEEVDDKDFGDDEVSEEGSDVDIASEEEDLEDETEEGHDEEDENKRKRKKPAKRFAPAKRKAMASSSAAKKPQPKLVPYEDDDLSTDEDDEEGSPDSAEREEESREAAESGEPDRKKKKLVVAPSGRSIRDSTAAKRFETEELELQRELRRQEIGPRKKIRHRVPTQQERLSRVEDTEIKNRADLAKYQRDEEENEKKKAKKQKIVRGPFDICTISTTVTMPSIEEVSNKREQALLREAESLNGHRPGERYARNSLCFRTDELFREAFPIQSSRPLPEKRACIITGKPARYRDPLTLQYYYDIQSLRALHDVLYKHLLSNATTMGNPTVLEFGAWYEAKYKSSAREDKFSEVGKFDFSSNAVREAVNGQSSKDQPVSS